MSKEVPNGQRVNADVNQFSMVQTPAAPELAAVALALLARTFRGEL